MYTCYLITNNINNRKYVGITSQKLEQRWQNHISESKLLPEQRSSRQELYSEISEYGVENYSIISLESNISQFDRDDKERYYIKLYQTHISEGGYNLETGGFKGFKSDDMTKQILSDKLSGENHPFFGKQFDSTHRLNISTSKKGRTIHISAGERYRRSWRVSRRNRSRIVSNETRNKISMKLSGMNGFWYSKTGPNKGKIMSDEQKLKISVATSGVNNPMYGKRGKDNPNYGRGKDVYAFDVITKQLLGYYDNARAAAEWIRSDIKPNGSIGTAEIEIRNAAKLGRVVYGVLWSNSCNLSQTK